MLNVSEHKLNVEAIIKNINTISLELEKMKVMSIFNNIYCKPELFQ
uniref:Chromosome 5 open reading frame 58 n=1 Tax=Equus asinus TaxID=9793 RepID=A0A9L0IM12_EQUAS